MGQGSIRLNILIWVRTPHRIAILYYYIKYIFTRSTPMRYTPQETVTISILCEYMGILTRLISRPCTPNGKLFTWGGKYKVKYKTDSDTAYNL